MSDRTPDTIAAALERGKVRVEWEDDQEKAVLVFVSIDGDRKMDLIVDTPSIGLVKRFFAQAILNAEREFKDAILGGDA